MRLSAILLPLTCLVAPLSAPAQTGPQIVAAPPLTTAPATDRRIRALVGVIAGTGDYQGFFSPAFHAALPKEKWDAVVASITAQVGKPQGVESFTADDPWRATVRLRFERGSVTAKIAVDPALPNQVVGLLFSGIELAGDTTEKLAADFRALPGKAGLGIYALGGGAPKLIAGVAPETPAPLGSAFKLWVLGELTREVAAGERKWSDVVPIGTPSLPSGMMQNWPAGAPVTLHTLATMMISISDNTATDTLVTLEGRKLDAFTAARGAPGVTPVLTTRQMFAIKSPANAGLAAQWAKATTPAARRALLNANAARLSSTTIDPGLFDGKPMAIGTLEWFASPAQTAAMLDWLRTDGDGTARAILGVNPGTGGASRALYDYVGFKGGSEPGVVSMNYLVRRKDGRWLAVAASWHRADASVDNEKFGQLLSRALALASEVTLPD